MFDIWFLVFLLTYFEEQAPLSSSAGEESYPQIRDRHHGNTQLE